MSSNGNLMSEWKLREEMCEIGRRVYNKGFAAANDGNISFRLSEDRVLCTPTRVSKGFMKPDDLCIVDMDGKQVSGKRKRSSEILLHLTLMKTRADIKSCVHCHPPHATAFAVAHEPIPKCTMPEFEVFLGEVAITPYETPGGQAFADTVIPYVKDTDVIILANHGTISFGETVEKAYWWTEILDAYCRILMMARDLGKVHYLNETKSRELLDLKTKWGYSDARLAPGMENCDICANDVFRESWQATGVERRAFDPPPPIVKQAAESTAAPAPGANVDQEALVQAITDRVLAALKGK